MRALRNRGDLQRRAGEEATTQVERDALAYGAPEHETKPITVEPVWDPGQGDVLIGEFAGDVDGCAGHVHNGETIRIRTGECVDVPVYITGVAMTNAFNEIDPDLRDLLRFRREKDGRTGRSKNSPVGRRYSVELAEPVEREGQSGTTG